MVSTKKRSKSSDNDESTHETTSFFTLSDGFNTAIASTTEDFLASDDRVNSIVREFLSSDIELSDFGDDFWTV